MIMMMMIMQTKSDSIWTVLLAILSILVATSLARLSRADSSGAPRSSSRSSSARYPVILVPGYQGSQLEGTFDGKSEVLAHCFPRRTPTMGRVTEVLWFRMANFAQRRAPCWLDMVRLRNSKETNSSLGAPGLEIRPKNFGSTSSVEYISPNTLSPLTNYFNSLVRLLVRRGGYQRDQDIRGASYDWRKAPDENHEFMNNLKSLVEETKGANGDTRVALLCHSMGCTFTYHFLRAQSQEWKDEFVKAIIITATPWDGNFKYLYSYLDKDDDVGSSLYPVIREAERTFPSLAFLLPHKRSFAPNETLIQTPTSNWTVNDYEAIFHFLGNEDALEYWRRSNGLLGNFEHPEVDIYCLGGSGVSTMSKVIYDGQFPDGPKRLLHDDGDGVLLAKSMRGCLRWRDSSLTGKKFHFKEFQATHMGVIQDRQPINYLLQILRTL